MELEPIDPETAVELYLADRQAELADETLTSHKSRLKFFVEWCDERDIENLNELTGRKLNEFRLWRRNTGDLAPASENCQMDTLRVFVRWLEAIDGAPQDLHQKVRSPTVGREEGSRDVMLDPDDAEAILTHLETYQYASIEHVTLTVLWRTMMRRGPPTGSMLRTTILRTSVSKSSTDRTPTPRSKTASEANASSRSQGLPATCSTTGFVTDGRTSLTTMAARHCWRRSTAVSTHRRLPGTATNGRGRA